ncbi:cytochrome P450 6k1-like [Papilio machaon]|uniref:cytochrome P450 6k1-like n=1 Tax=Papilio machaon TaxID=76193 RepID=UPI001E665D1F|nr:cytochrome P450 6k1-like [Papilio machaon]
MFLLLLTFTAPLLLVWVYVRWLKVKRYWADRGVPFVPPNPLLGNLTFLQRYNSGIWMRNLYHSYRRPYVGIWLFWRPALVVNSVEIGRRVLISDAAFFRDRLVTSGDSDPIGKYNLFTVKEPVWSSLRRRLTPVFTAAKLRSMHSLVNMKTKELMQRIQNDMTESQSVNLRKVFTDYTTDVIGGVSLGFVGEATLSGRGPLRTVTQQFMDYDFFRGVSWLLMFFWPTWVNFFGLTAFPKSSIDILKRVYQTALTQRGGYETEVKETRDLLDALIKIKQDRARDNEDMPEEKLIAHTAVFVLGGFDTTATVLSWCVYELAFHPEIQENMYIELLNLQEDEEKLKDFDAGSLSNLSYLNAVIDDHV